MVFVPEVVGHIFSVALVPQPVVICEYVSILGEIFCVALAPRPAVIRKWG